MRAPEREGGFVLIVVLLMLMGISALAATMIFNAKQGQVTANNHKNRIRAFYASDGIRALLAQEVLDGNFKRYSDSTSVGEIEGEVYEGAGGSLAALQAATGGAPSSTLTSDYLGSYLKNKDNYGIRWRGYITPPTSGSYTFLVRADDEGAFYLSEDEKPSNLSKDPIAIVESWKFEWPKWGPGISKPVSLKMGQRYYFEFFFVQGGGNGFGQVGWNGPKYLSERPIPGKRLSAYGTKSEKWDTTKVSNGMVKYALKEAGPLVYSINTEAIMGGKGDSVFHAPLAQTISMRGDNPAPPPRLWQRVIFYDYRTDTSNPEFERGLDFSWGVVTTGLVQQKGLRYTTEDADWFGLDSIGKPRRGPSPRFSCGVEKWFSPWQPGWFRTYNYAGGSGDCTESGRGDDRAFENRVIRDSIEFVRRDDLGVNAYQFQRAGDPEAPYMAYAPLDGRGFGDEGKTDDEGTPHNFGFCLELHSQFEHTSGMRFEFNGDDDVWLFINDSLVMDLGFVHKSHYAAVELDDLPLKFGETYPLDFFYCERQSTRSSIDLITNLPMLQIATKPSSSWKRDYGNLE